jgi:ABC-2 type transport system permease protein
VTSVLETQAVVAEEPGGGFTWMLRDWRNEASRHLRAMPRNPDILIFALMQPIMFVLLFKYVFGGSIQIPGFDKYDQYLMPGIFAQTVVFNSSFTGVGLAEDMSKGFVDRLRSLPIFQSAVIVGRTLSDFVRNCLTFLIMLGVAFALGFRFEGGLLRGIGATLLLLLFSYSFSWISALIGISVKSVEAANSAGFIWMFPLTFISSAFVSTGTMPGPLQAVADVNPFTIATNASRALYNGRDPGNDVWFMLAWAIGIIVVFSGLSLRKFKAFSK